MCASVRWTDELTFQSKCVYTCVHACVYRLIGQVDISELVFVNMFVNMVFVNTYPYLFMRV